MHAAKLKSSDRLQRVLAVLSEGGWYSTRQIIRMAQVCAVNSVISELRANGVQIECKQFASTRGRPTIWRYRLRVLIAPGQPHPDML